MKDCMFWTCKEMKKDQSFAFISRFEVWFLMGTQNFFLVPHLWQDRIGLSLHLDFQIAICSISWDSFKTWSIFYLIDIFDFMYKLSRHTISKLCICVHHFFFHQSSTKPYPNQYHQLSEGIRWLELCSTCPTGSYLADLW